MIKRRDAIVGGLSGLAALSMPLSVEANAPIAKLTPPQKDPILVAVVVGRDAAIIDFVGPWEVFNEVTIPSRGSSADDQTPFRTALVSDRTEPLEIEGGMQVVPRFTFETFPAQPNIIVMGAQGDHTPAKVAWIKKASEKADLVMSVCTGAFLLAKTGLLDGLSATTHHDFYDQFAKQFPQVRLVRGPRYVENGKIATGGGLTSGIELALRVVERYFGDSAARETANYMEYNRSSHRPVG
ncbi:MAG: DJ-1/PfpI family protein [Candidatus Eremiobacteraeota bacterium]|nr:DJ-1/PfpI family protein [Candidatus Eremiobacteraeota bacterium]